MQWFGNFVQSIISSNWAIQRFRVGSAPDNIVFNSWQLVNHVDATADCCIYMIMSYMTNGIPSVVSDDMYDLVCACCSNAHHLITVV